MDCVDADADDVSHSFIAMAIGQHKTVSRAITKAFRVFLVVVGCERAKEPESNSVTQVGPDALG